MRVLVVDDEPLVREDILYLLQSGEYHVEALQAADGEEALRVMGQNPVDAVLLDICMPNMDGLTLLKHIRSEHPYVHVVIISGWDNFSYAQQAMRDGAVDYLLKPIDLQAFGEAIHRVVDKAGAGGWISDGRHSQREYDLLQVEQLVNQYLLGVSVRPDAKGILAPHAMAAVLCYAQNNHAEDEMVFSVSAVLAQYADQVFDQPGERCHVIPYYGASNELILVACGNCHDAQQRFNRLLAYAIDELSHQGWYAFFASAADVPDAGAANLVQTHGQLLDTLRLRFSSDERLLFPKPYPADADTIRSACMREAALLKASAASLTRETAQALFSSFFTPVFFDVMTAAQAQTIFTAVENAMLEACHPSGDIARSLRAGDRSMQCFCRPHEVAGYLASFLPAQCNEGHQVDIASLMKDVRAYVRDNFLHPLTLHMLAERFFINPNYLSCMYKEINGVNFIDDLITLRVRHAMRLLGTSPISISKVAELSGYASQAYFQKVFKKHTGVTPNEYRLNNVKSSSVDIG